jgi:hypothetical protein
VVATSEVNSADPPKGDMTTDGGTVMKATYRAPTLKDVGSFRERTHGWGFGGWGGGFGWGGGWGWGHGWGGWGWGWGW